MNDLFQRGGARPPAGAPTTVEGTLEKIVYHNDDNAWSVARVVVEGRKDAITVVGNLLGVQAGESLRMRGAWVLDKRFGEQFRVESYLTLVPSTVLGIERYLASGMVRGVGRAMAQRLVAHFGLATLDVIESHAERLVEVEGIGPVRSRSIRDAWIAQREIEDVMVFLQSHGVSTAFAIRIYKRYGARAIAVVRANPYQLALDIFGIGFRTADAIAARLGIAGDAPARLEAGVLHALGVQAEAGHCYVARDELVRLAGELLGSAEKPIEEARIEAAIDALGEAGHVAIEPLPSGQAVFQAALAEAERALADRLRLLASTAPRPITIDVPRALAWFEADARLTLAPEQRRAVERAITSKVMVITGGPGTGKTTIINAIIRILEKKGRRILLCAPTGRAAKRMTQATGHEAKTAHRLLEFTPQGRTFQRDHDHPLEADVLVVDEMSMVDVVLARHLCDAVPPACQLVLVGDVDQLPSVGPGSVLRDVIRSRAVDVVTLREVFRQAEQSLIVVNAHRINAGLMPQLPRPSDEPGAAAADFFCIERDSPDETLATIRELVSQRIPRRFGLDAVDDVQVLTPMNKGSLGAAQLNVELQALLNPIASTSTATAAAQGNPVGAVAGQGETLVRGAKRFRVGDKVMQLRNNYELDVYNGDLGRVRAIDDVERKMVVRIDDHDVVYDQADLDELQLAYACTIHKSQGSEYPAVVIPLDTQHFVMLQRNLLYTAVTRGRRLVVLVGNARAIGIAVRNLRMDERNTRLAERLAAIQKLPA